MKPPLACYVPWLHFHQPLVWWKSGRKEQLIGNLEKMLLGIKNSREEHDARLMAMAYKNPAVYVKELKKKGYDPKMIVDFSGILLENLNEIWKNKTLRGKEVRGKSIGNIISAWKKTLEEYPSSIEVTGTAYSHCYFPATPEKDWEYQIDEWRNIFKKLFGKEALERVKGFWFPEMGIPGEEKKLSELIRLIKKAGYEWVILPIECLPNEREMSFEDRVQTTSQPHMLLAGNESIPVIFRVRYDFIDQQAGCDAGGIYEKSIDAAKIFHKNKPALVVPASDGENGNVMLNEFYKATFVPFFRKKIDEKVTSMTITEFLYEYYGKEKNGEMRIVPENEVKVRPIGGSWMGGHEIWMGDKDKMNIHKKTKEISQMFHRVEKKIKDKSDKKIKKSFEEAKKALLIAETSCYVYWGTKFWYKQGEKIIKFAKEKINDLERLL